MKGIIIYKGKYGATRQYAEWLKDELGYPVTDAEHSKEALLVSDIVILGSSVYIGKLQLSGWLRKNVSILGKKKIILFIVCGTPANEKKKLDTYVQSSVPEEIRNNCSIYFLPGRLVYKKLSLKDKFMLRMGAMLPGDPNVKKAMLTDYDAVKKENLNELLGNRKKIEKTAEIVQHS